MAQTDGASQHSRYQANIASGWQLIGQIERFSCLAEGRSQQLRGIGQEETDGSD